MQLDLVPEHEPTVLEYARFHGLCKEFMLEQPPLHMKQLLSDEEFDLDLSDPPGAPPLTNPANELTKERLAVNKETAFLLRSVHSLLESQGEISLTSDRRRHIFSFKQEVPLLHTDNELDLLNFGNTATPSFDNVKVPLEPVNEENDEGLEWPSKYSAYPAQCYEQAKSERLAIPKDILYYLQDAIKDQFDPRHVEDIKAETLTYERNRAIQPLTPPLFPLTPPMAPYVPSSPTNHLQLLSEDSNSTAVEAKALEDKIMGADGLVQHDSKSDYPMLLDLTDDERRNHTFEPHALKNKRKADDLRVEGPLTPPIFSESPAKKLKSVTFSAMVQFISEVSSTCENGDDVLSPEDDFAGFCQEIEPLAKEANRKIENERLSEADTTTRVDVPHLDFTLPVAPWDDYKHQAGRHGIDDTELDAQMKFLLLVKRTLMKGAESWHGLSKLERELLWEPFPTHATKITIAENLHGEESLNKLLDETRFSDIITSSSAVWNRDELRILEDDEVDDEELELAELGQSEETRDLYALARKRKLELEDVAGDARHKPNEKNLPSLRLHMHQKPVGESLHWKGRVPAHHPLPTPPPKTLHYDYKGKVTATKSNASQEPKESDRSLMFGGKFSASNALENFMVIQGMSLGPSQIDEHNTAASVRPPAPTVTLPVRSTEHILEPTSASSWANMEPEHRPQSRPPRLPSIPKDLPSCSFIISSALLQQRSLSKQIEKLYSNAEFVSRDFELPHSAANEADLLLSPSTGLIITTLQQVKQRALPGQPDRSPTKERVSYLQYRYERLVVMVTEGLNREMEQNGSSRPIDARDEQAVELFKTYASQMEGEVLVKYVPGGEQALALSIVGEMAMYGLPLGSKDIGDIKPLPDETNWELFLRRTGLNPFAAQVILAWLKDTVDYPLTSSSPTSSSGGKSQTVSTFGLQTFLMMPVKQRIESFQAVLGGSRILGRVSALLDQEWVSAAHGFRMG